MTHRAILVLDRGIARHADLELDLRESGATLALLEFLLSQPEHAATLLEISEDWHRSKLDTWEREAVYGRLQASRQRLYRAREILDKAFGPGWLRALDSRAKPPRYCLFRGETSVSQTSA